MGKHINGNNHRGGKHHEGPPAVKSFARYLDDAPADPLRQVAYWQGVVRYLLDGRTKARLTKRQQDAYDAIKAYQEEHGQSPTQKELAELLGIAQCNSHNLMKGLVSRGHAEMLPGASRSIRLL